MRRHDLSKDPSCDRRTGGRFPFALVSIIGALAIGLGLQACDEFPTTTEVDSPPTFRVVIEADTIRLAAAADTAVDAFVEMYQNGREQGQLQGASIQWSPAGYVSAGGVLTVPELTEGLILVATYSDDRASAQPDTLVVSTWPMVSIEPTGWTAQSLMETLDFNAVARDAQGNLHNDWTLNVTWTSGDESVARVDADGLVTAWQNGGPVAIIAATDYTADTVWVQVRQQLASLDGPSSMDALGDTVHFYGLDPGGRGYGMNDIRFHSTNESVLRVDSLTGTAVSVGNGSVQVRGTTPRDTCWYGVSVSQTITHVTVDPAVDTLRSISATTQLAGQALDRRDSPVGGASLTWTSRDGAVVSVDASGQVTAVGPGTTAVVAEAGGVADSAIITVRLPVDSVAMAPTTVTFTALGDTTRAVATVLDATGYELTDAPVAWASTDTLVATVDGTGLITAVDQGAATITATAEGAVGSVDVTVTQVVDTMAVSPAAATIRTLGSSAMLTAEPRDANGYAVPGVTVSWESSDTLVATVAGGVVTAVDAGTATVTATGSGVAGTAAITVDQVVDSLFVSPDSVGFDALGGTAVLTVEAYDSGGAAIAEPGLVWTSTDTLVVTADTGVITSVGNGTADVTAAADGVGATVKATVQQVVVGVNVTPDSVTIDALGDTTRLAGAAVDANGYPVAGPGLTWESADTLTAVVDGAGLVTGVANGVTVVRATGGAGTDSAVVTVAQRVDSVAVSPETLLFTALQDSQEATAQPLDALGNPVVGASVVWSIADTLIATLDTTTLVTVTAAATGTTTLSATAGSVTGTATINVSQVAGSVVVSPDTLRINAIGYGDVLLAQAYDANANLIPDPMVTWTSSDTLVAAVDSLGNVVAVGNGTVAVVAMVDAAVDTTWVVVAQVPADLLVSPVPANVDMGSTIQLTAEVVDSNGVAIPGQSISWISDDPTIASVDGTGLVTGQNLGSTVVTATSSTVSGNTDVNVSLPGLVEQRLSASLSGEFVCDVVGGGNAYCWGRNENGQLGTGNTSSTTVPVAMSGGVIFAAVSAGTNHACGLTFQGEAYCWGWNGNGQVGSGTYDQALSPTPVTGGHTFKQVAAGSEFSCGLDLAGDAYCWGRNNSGQLGYGGYDYDVPTPTLVTGGHTWQRLDLGNEHACGLTTGNEIYCWGDNNYGRLGDNTWSTQWSPSLVAGGFSWSAVSAGSEHTCGITTAGAAYCWGIDNLKQLGHDNGDQGAPNFPVNGALTYQSIEAGSSHTCAVTTDDQLVCWGYNNNGELGTGSMDWALSSPALVNTPVSFQQLGLSWEVTCGITASDQTWCWGQRGAGMLGDGVPGYYLTPGDVSIPLSVATNGLGDPENYVCHIGTDGVTYCAGRNDSGQLGDGTTIDRYTLAPVLTGETFTQVDVGNWSHTCAINTVGEAYCWGNGGSGQLGDGAYDQQLTPTLVSGGYTWQDISAHDQTCGVTTGGALYCWGSNWRGQAGQGTDNNSYNVPTLVDDTHNWTQVEASQGYGCGLTDTGDAYCWGSDWDCVGLLGTGSYCTTYAAPSLVAGGHQFSKISVGEWHACGITTTGEGYCWGQNNRGELGNGNQINQSTPVRAGILLYSDIDVGDNSTCATKTDGTEVCWGGNDNGDLGTGNWNDTSSPTFLAGGIDFATIRTGRGATCGVTFANQLYCWGNRGYGVFGDGFAGFTTSPAQVIGH